MYHFRPIIITLLLILRYAIASHGETFFLRLYAHSPRIPAQYRVFLKRIYPDPNEFLMIIKPLPTCPSAENQPLPPAPPHCQNQRP